MTLARFALVLSLAGLACSSPRREVHPDGCRYSSGGVKDTPSGIPVLTLRAVCPRAPGRPVPAADKYVEAGSSGAADRPN